MDDFGRLTVVRDGIGSAQQINGQVVEKYLWQGRTQLLAVYNASDEVVMRFGYAGDRMPVRMVKDGQTYYLAYDQVGTLRAIFDAEGVAVKTVEYDSFGNVIADSAPEFAVPFGFAGGLHDRDTGLVRFGYRDYDPDTGRWTAKDPIGFEGGDSDVFQYCVANPISNYDAYGLLFSPVPCNPETSLLCQSHCEKMGRELTACKEIPEIRYWCKCEDDGWRENCIRLYYLCRQNGWTGRCDDCLNKCTSQHEWDFGMCFPGRGN